MARMSGLQPEELSGDQRAVYDKVMAGPRKSIRGPVSYWLRNPDLADRAQEFGNFARFRYTIPKRLVELAILFMGGHWQANFEWHLHSKVAEAEGIDPAAIAAIHAGEAPRLERADEAAVYTFCKALVADRAMPQEIYDRAVAALGEQGVVELVGILGYYALISMTCVAFDIPLPGDAPYPFDREG